MIDIALMSDETLARVLAQRLTLDINPEVVSQDDTSRRVCVTVTLKCGEHNVCSSHFNINEAL